MTERPSRLVLLGHPVAHSLSPLFQNAALRRAGIRLSYEALDVLPERLDDALAALVRERAAGNVTLPHKAAVAARCDRLTEVAHRAGAVNTFWVGDGGLVGDNTDVDGFDAAAARLLGGRPVGARVLLLGAGGAAAGVLTAVERWPRARVAVAGRDAARVAALVARFAPTARAASSLADALRWANLVVNATPVGLLDDTHPAPAERLAPGAAVLDLVYRRGETAWVRAARAAGHPAADGTEMLIEQGALAFARWLGVEPDRAAMRDALRAAAE